VQLSEGSESCPLKGSGRLRRARLPGVTAGQARLAALVRIATGVLFIAEGYGKITGPFVQGGFSRSVSGMASESWPFWRSFLESGVKPHAAVFGWFVALGELAL